jgi:glycosyltransferase involved in cell wall biosynthesis
MSKIKILAIPPDVHGVGKFRITDPYKYIGDNYANEFHVDLVFNLLNDDKSFDGYDAVIFHSFIHQTNHDENLRRINWLKKQGIKVIMDIDDFWFVDQRHPMYFKIKESKIGEQKVEMLKLSDYITTTTSVFAQTIKDKLNVKNVLVFPNSVNEDEQQFKINPTKSNKIRFGWLGGSSHLYDLELLQGGISQTINSFKDKTQFVLCGFDLRGNVTEIERETGKMRTRPIKPLETVWYKYEEIFTDKYKSVDEDYKKYLMQFIDQPYNDLDKPYVRKWTKEITSYASNYNSFDVSLAPLVENNFNSNKSQLKVIEAGFHKKAVIASHVKPYTLDLISALNDGKFNDKGNALVVPPSKNHKEWGKHMKKLIENPNMIEDLGNKLYETVKDKYSLKNVCADRVEFFKSIINK